MPNVIEGERTGAGARFAIAVSRYNDTITRRLLAGAVDTLLAHGVTDFATANVEDFEGLGFRRVWNPLASNRTADEQDERG